jgi:hypothetical protein
MGYHTEFSGSVAVDPPLSPEVVAEFTKFSETRHGGDTSRAPWAPSYYCQWVPTADGTAIEWDGGEKFYGAEEWMTVVIDRFVKPAGSVANGEISAAGEESGDLWKLVVKDNVVKRHEGTVTYAEEK